THRRRGASWRSRRSPASTTATIASPERRPILLLSLTRRRWLSRVLYRRGVLPGIKPRALAAQTAGSVEILRSARSSSPPVGPPMTFSTGTALCDEEQRLQLRMALSLLPARQRRQVLPREVDRAAPVA